MITVSTHECRAASHLDDFERAAEELTTRTDQGADGVLVRDNLLLHRKRVQVPHLQQRNVKIRSAVFTLTYPSPPRVKLVWGASERNPRVQPESYTTKITVSLTKPKRPEVRHTQAVVFCIVLWQWWGGGWAQGTVLFLEGECLVNCRVGGSTIDGQEEGWG